LLNILKTNKNADTNLSANNKIQTTANTKTAPRRCFAALLILLCLTISYSPLTAQTIPVPQNFQLDLSSGSAFDNSTPTAIESAILANYGILFIEFTTTSGDTILTKARVTAVLTDKFGPPAT